MIEFSEHTAFLLDQNHDSTATACVVDPNACDIAVYIGYDDNLVAF